MLANLSYLAGASVSRLAALLGDLSSDFIKLRCNIEVIYKTNCAVIVVFIQSKSRDFTSTAEDIALCSFRGTDAISLLTVLGTIYKVTT